MKDTFDRVEFLRKVSILKGLAKSQLHSLSGALMEQRFSTGSNIVTEVCDVHARSLSWQLLVDSRAWWHALSTVFVIGRATKTVTNFISSKAVAWRSS